MQTVAKSDVRARSRRGAAVDRGDIRPNVCSVGGQRRRALTRHSLDEARRTPTRSARAARPRRPGGGVASPGGHARSRGSHPQIFQNKTGGCEAEREKFWRTGADAVQDGGMKRRGFLRFLALAPFVGSAVVKSVAVARRPSPRRRSGRTMYGVPRWEKARSKSTLSACCDSTSPALHVFTSVAAAVETARPGDTVMVMPGEYREAMVRGQGVP